VVSVVPSLWSIPFHILELFISSLMLMGLTGTLMTLPFARGMVIIPCCEIVMSESIWIGIVNFMDITVVYLEFVLK